MTDFNNLGQAALWKGKGDNPKAPALKGNFVAHRNIRAGEEIDLAFWKTDGDNPNAPALKGKCSDKFVPQGRDTQSRGAYMAEQEQGDYDDSNPF